VNKRTWPLVAIAFGVLIGAFALSGIAVYRDYRRIYNDVQTVQRRYQTSEGLLNVIRSELYSMAILVRDYLLNSSSSVDRQERQELLAIRESLLGHVGELEKTIDPAEKNRLKELRDFVQQYSGLTDSIFEWTPEEKRVRSFGFLRREIVPFRNHVLKIASDIAQLNSADLQRREAEIRSLEQGAESFLLGAIGLASAFGLVVAALVVWRTRSLEDRSESYNAALESEREELRRLSSKLVSAQEEERKAISRELHDQIGQLLTGLKIELLHLNESRSGPEEIFTKHLSLARTMAEDTLKGIRHLATGLRPAVLDQLGLEPAVQWQAREHTRMTGVPVNVVVDGSLDTLTDDQRTCAFRVVQEALTNCARHAAPQSIRVCVHGGQAGLIVSVQDDGRGFAAGPEARKGIGLIGMEERISELGGRLKVSSQPGKGTIVAMELPIAREVAV
jgi:signal transduction histidine kinase